jgi:hypothetical protein
MGSFKSKPARLGYTAPTAITTSVTRVWKNVNVADLKIGDIVAGKGRVVSEPMISCDSEYLVYIGYPDDELYAFSETESIYAFVEKEGS